MIPPWCKISIVVLELLFLVSTLILILNNHEKLNKVILGQEKLQIELNNILPLLEESSMSGENELSMKRIIHLLNSIEQFTRTTPLVECGNYYGHRKEGSVQQRDK